MGERDMSKELPSWLLQEQDFEPVADRDGFVTRTFLQLSGMLAQLRMDGAGRSHHAPDVAVELLCVLGCIVLTSLATNFLFVCVMLAIMLVRACMLPSRALGRFAKVTLATATLTLLVMLPSVFLGQPRSAITLTTKALVCTGMVMETALSTPVADLTAALRSLRVPSVVILTLELTLRSIVDLGTVALKVLEALKLRSVGKNDRKAASMGGVGGVVFVKAAHLSQQTYDAMRCRCFTGTYDVAHATGESRLVSDAACLGMLAALLLLFFRLEGMV
jgi:cobalt/nickel transport system permease protein